MNNRQPSFSYLQAGLRHFAPNRTRSHTKFAFAPGSLLAALSRRDAVRMSAYLSARSRKLAFRIFRKMLARAVCRCLQSLYKLLVRLVADESLLPSQERSREKASPITSGNPRSYINWLQMDRRSLCTRLCRNGIRLELPYYFLSLIRFSISPAYPKRGVFLNLSGATHL